jgi:hypothetical protein
MLWNPLGDTLIVAGGNYVFSSLETHPYTRLMEIRVICTLWTGQKERDPEN